MQALSSGQPTLVKRTDRRDNFKKKDAKPLASNSLESLLSQILALQKNLANPKDKERYQKQKEELEKNGFFIMENGMRSDDPSLQKENDHKRKTETDKK